MMSEQVLASLESDMKVSDQVFNTKFTPSDFADFVQTNMLTALMGQQRDCDVQLHVIRRTLLAIAGTVWLVTGVNVVKLGIMSSAQLSEISVLDEIGMVVVFAAFGFMFYRMNGKHSTRILTSAGDTKPFWHFFDLKAYLIMTIMMAGGIALRSSGLVSPEFIAVFYTGLGTALALAGVIFWVRFFTYNKTEHRHSSDAS